MMGMGPHTNQVFSLAFLIPFFHRTWWYLSLFTQYQTFFFWLGSITWLFFSLNWNVRIKGNCFDGYGIGGPILIMLYSLNFHISTFRKEKMTMLQLEFSSFYLLLIDIVYVMPCIHDICLPSWPFAFSINLLFVIDYLFCHW